ncbi:MAG TPA: acyl-CoA dehydrogenase family protein, partial [Candidatus Eisenbacteria bacterium]|nr:acyl-CoA dehydrogenase family protein [Candidatus Eisenbacteria bacterium]
ALGLVDLVVLMEEMGRAVAPGPYFSTVLLGGLAILEAGGDAQKKEWLPRIAAGDKRVALAWMEPSAQLGPAGVTLTAVKRGETFTLSGTKLFVHDAHTADALVVAARTRSWARRAGAGPRSRACSTAPASRSARRCAAARRKSST